MSLTGKFEHFREVLGLDWRRSWFYHALAYLDQVPALRGRPWTYYEFGVGYGGSLTAYLKALRSRSREMGRPLSASPVFAFDTFKGLPPSSDPRDLNPGWHPGKFATSREAVNAKVRRLGFNRETETVHLIEGAFADTLTSARREPLSAFPPSIVLIDCDYYSSAILVLEWLRPLLRSGCLVFFDDLWEFFGHPDYGELAAIREFNARREGLLSPFPQIQPIRWGGSFIYAAKQLEWDGAVPSSK